VATDMADEGICDEFRSISHKMRR